MDGMAKILPTCLFTMLVTQIMQGRGNNAIYTAGEGWEMLAERQHAGPGEQCNLHSTGKGRGTAAERRQIFRLDHLNY